MIFASSNHSIGFHERAETIGADTQFLPDGFYGLSKAYGELMGRLYWFKHGVESVFIRIGSCFPGADQRADAGDLAVVSGPLPAGGALRDGGACRRAA